MKVRTRLVVAFAYVLITVIVALTVPLTINLRARATTELKSAALSNAQTFAGTIGAEGLLPDQRQDLRREVSRFAAQIPGGRVVVTDAAGTVVADSAGLDLGTDFVTTGRPEMLAALDAASPVPFTDIRPSEDLGQDLLVAAAPIIDERLAGAVRVSQDISEVTTNVRRVTVGLLIVGFTGLLAGLVIAFALAGSLARPLTRLASAARRLGSGDLSARADQIGGASEIADLARSFDEMADRLERTVSAQREFVANASHQLRTPLTGMKLRLESAVAEAPSDGLRDQLRAADREVDRLSETVDRLLVMAREIEHGTRSVEPIDLRVAAERAAERWSERSERLGSSIVTRGEAADAPIDANDLDQILDNLIDNAIAYAGGTIEIETGETFIAVRDRGPGIAADERPRVTERFYRGRGAPPGGSGLGLAIVGELTRRWGAELEITDAPGGGTLARITFRTTP